MAVPLYAAMKLVCEACDAHESDTINKVTVALAQVAEDGVYNGVSKDECDNRAAEIRTGHTPQAVQMLDAFYKAVYVAYAEAAASGE